MGTKLIKFQAEMKWSTVEAIHYNKIRVKHDRYCKVKGKIGHKNMKVN